MILSNLEGRERCVAVVGERAELRGGGAERGARGVRVHLGVVREVDMLATVVLLETHDECLCGEDVRGSWWGA